MTTKEFFSKHYGSVSVAVFGLGLLTVLGLYGGNIANLTSSPAPSTPPAEAQPAPPVPASEQVPEQQDEAPAKDETAEPEKDALEQAIAAEQAKADERREQIRAEIAKEREEAGLPPLPPAEAAAESGN